MSPFAADLTIVNGDSLEAALPPRACIELMRAAMIEVSAGRTVMPQRQAFAIVAGDARIGVMPGGVERLGRFGVKLVSLFPGNAARGLSTHMGLYILYDGMTGQPLAVMDAGRLTAIRTAAVTALATKTLAAGTRTVAMLGAGEQAERHCMTLVATLDLDTIRLWSRDPGSSERLAAGLKGIQATVIVCHDIARATRGADVICTCTSAHDPFLTSELVDDGTHINLVGSSFADRAEAEPALLARGRVFVDAMTSAIALAGDIRRAIDTGVMQSENIAGEIGEVLADAKAGRQTPSEVTIFKSVGVAAQDVAAASHAFDSLRASAAAATARV